MKNNNSGGFITVIVLALMGAVSIYTAVLFYPQAALGRAVNTRISEIQSYHCRRAAVERVLALFESNISYSLPVDFDDLNVYVNIEEISIEKEPVYIIRQAEEQELDVYFDIYSETTAYIDITASGPLTVHLYSPSGSLIRSGTVDGYDTWVLDDIYDSSTDTWGWGYGTYRLHTGPGSSIVEVSYEQTVSRTVAVETINRYTVKIDLAPKSKNRVYVLY